MTLKMKAPGASGNATEGQTKAGGFTPTGYQKADASSNRLPVLAEEIRRAHADAQEAEKTAAERDIAAGHALIEAKALCKHGGWAAWLAECGIPERSAQRYMRLSRSGLESATVADFGVAQAERVAGVIEKAWPEAGRVRLFSGRSARDVFWAVTYRPDDAAFAYYSLVRFHGVDEAYPHGVGGQSLAMQKPAAPLALALGHLSEVGGIPIQASHDLAGEEAEKTFAAVGARLIRHPWGTRLEPIAGAR